MARELYSSIDGWDLVYDEQDARGRDAVDADGTRLGQVTDMIADTDAQRIVALVLDDGTHIDADRVELQADRVVVQSSATGEPSYGTGSHLRVRTVHTGEMDSAGLADQVGRGDMATAETVSGTDAAYGAGSAMTGAAMSGTDASAGGMRRFEDYDADFRSDYARDYGMSGGSYEETMPAYRYGYDLGGHDTYRSRTWDDSLEGDLSRDYETQYGEGTWDRIKHAVKSGFERAGNAVTGGHDDNRSTPY